MDPYLSNAILTRLRDSHILRASVRSMPVCASESLPHLGSLGDPDMTPHDNSMTRALDELVVRSPVAVSQMLICAMSSRAPKQSDLSSHYMWRNGGCMFPKKHAPPLLFKATSGWMLAGVTDGALVTIDLAVDYGSIHDGTVGWGGRRYGSSRRKVGMGEAQGGPIIILLVGLLPVGWT